MPRLIGSQGRPGTPVIPPGWAAHHRPVVVKTMTGTVSIRRPGTKSTFDPATGATTATEYEPHHIGPARLQVLSLADQEALAGGQEVSTVAYLVTVEHDAATAGIDFGLGDLVKVDAVDDNGDSTLVGRELTVESLTRGSLVFERDLYCTDNLG